MNNFKDHLIMLFSRKQPTNCTALGPKTRRDHVLGPVEASQGGVRGRARRAAFGPSSVKNETVHYEAACMCLSQLYKLQFYDLFSRSHCKKSDRWIWYTVCILLDDWIWENSINECERASVFICVDHIHACCWLNIASKKDLMHLFYWYNVLVMHF